MNILRKIDCALMKFIEWVGIVLVFSMTIVIALQIAMRTFFTPLMWSEELARIMMIWVIFLAAAYLYNLPKNGHILVDVVLQNVPKNIGVPRASAPNSTAVLAARWILISVQA